MLILLSIKRQLLSLGLPRLIFVFIIFLVYAYTRVVAYRMPIWQLIPIFSYSIILAYQLYQMRYYPSKSPSRVMLLVSIILVLVAVGFRIYLLALMASLPFLFLAPNKLLRVRLWSFTSKWLFVYQVRSFLLLDFLGLCFLILLSIFRPFLFNVFFLLFAFYVILIRSKDLGSILKKHLSVRTIIENDLIFAFSYLTLLIVFLIYSQSNWNQFWFMPLSFIFVVLVYASFRYKYAVMPSDLRLILPLLFSSVALIPLLQLLAIPYIIYNYFSADE